MLKADFIHVKGTSSGHLLISMIIEYPRDASKSLFV